MLRDIQPHYRNVFFLFSFLLCSHCSSISFIFLEACVPQNFIFCSMCLCIYIVIHSPGCSQKSCPRSGSRNGLYDLGLSLGSATPSTLPACHLVISVSNKTVPAGLCPSKAPISFSLSVIIPLTLCPAHLPALFPASFLPVLSAYSYRLLPVPRSSHSTPRHIPDTRCMPSPPSVMLLSL